MNEPAREAGDVPNEAPQPEAERPAPLAEPSDGREGVAPSGGTLPAELARPSGPRTPGTPDEGADAGRRTFFQQFMSDAVQAAATIAGAANALQRTGMEAAGSLLRLAETGDAGQATAGPAAVGPVPVASGSGARSPYRVEEGSVVLLDLRRFPGEVVEIPCQSGAEASALIRAGAVLGPASIAGVAVYALCETVDRARTSSPYARGAIIPGSAQALRNSAPHVGAVRHGLDRLLEAYRAAGEEEADGDLVASVLRQEADAFVLELLLDHGRLAQAGVGALPATGDRPLRALVHGLTGPLACGQVGSAFGVLAAAAAAGRPVEVVVTEGRPGTAGSRLSTWEFVQAGLPVSLVADTAVGWLLAERRVDVVLVGADAIAADGAVAAAPGTYPIAALAALHGVPLLVCAPLVAFDEDVPDGGRFHVVLRDPTDVLGMGVTRLAPLETGALNPAFDVTPPSLVSAFVTDEGVLAPPFGPALESARAAATARHAEARAAAAEAAAAADEPAADAPAEAESGAQPDAPEPGRPGHDAGDGAVDAGAHDAGPHDGARSNDEARTGALEATAEPLAGAAAAGSVPGSAG